MNLKKLLGQYNAEVFYKVAANKTATYLLRYVGIPCVALELI